MQILVLGSIGAVVYVLFALLVARVVGFNQRGLDRTGFARGRPVVPGFPDTVAGRD